MTWTWAAIGLGLTIVTVPSMAQQSGARAKFADRVPQANAILDASGRVVPFPVPGSIEVIGAPNPQEGPCPAATPLSSIEAANLIQRIATEEKFDPKFALSVASVGSQLNSTAMSATRAYGLMQITPETAQRFKIDLCNPANNIRGGVLWLKVLQSRTPNPLYVVAAYHAGEQALTEHHGIPPFPDTVRFVADVINDFYHWPAADAAPLPNPDDSVLAARGDLAKPETRAKPNHSRQQNPAINDAWNGGFVMHVE